MPEFLTSRNGTWHFVRRVPREFAHLDPRGVIRHSTKVRVTQDRLARRASRIAETLNEKLEAHWRRLAGVGDVETSAYESARKRAREIGYEYVDADRLLELPPEVRLQRLEALVSGGLLNDQGARAALLGTEKRPSFLLSRLFIEYEEAVQDELKDMSPEQMRIWRNGRMRAVKNFVSVIGDKPVSEITQDDAIDYCEWWRARIREDDGIPKTANKDIGQLSRMLKEMSVRRRLNLPDVFKGLRLKGETDRPRTPYDTAYIHMMMQGKALDGLNEDAKLVLHVMADTGLRPSEVVNLTARTIHLGGPIPYVSVLPEGRRLKTEDSRREIPLVGTALAALQKRPNGFPHYRDNGSGLSATLNKYLTENKLRPSKAHTVYSLRHSFKDRLIAVEAPDSLIDSLMGHKTYKPKYGKGPSLDLKLKYLQLIALKAPAAMKA